MKPSQETLHRRYQAWVEKTPDLLIILDGQGNFIDIHPGLEFTPISLDCIGTNISTVIPEIELTTLQALRECKEKSSSFEYALDTDHFEARIIPLEGDFYSIVIREVTTKVFTENALKEIVAIRTQELENSNDDLRQLFYAASHDLREPLLKIKSFGERLSSIYSDRLDTRGKDYLKIMLSGGNRMLALIDDLLQYSRLGNIPNKTQVNLGDILAEVEEALKFKGVEPSPSLAISALPIILAEESLIYLLFQNLMSNSLKFRHKEKTPHIIVTTAEPTDTHEVIIFGDNGVGFKPEYAEKIFKIFERLVSRFEYPGTGIGLALCKRIMTKHGGWIKAESSPNEGTRFYLGFPKESCSYDN